MSTPDLYTDIRPLILELVTEELPPKALDALGRAFAAGARETLDRLGLLDSAACVCTDYATPRRLAVHLTHVRGHAPDQAYSEKLMPAHIGLTEAGEISPALAKKLAAKNLTHLTAADLIRRSDGKQDTLYAEGQAAGSTLAAGLQAALDHALASLPIPKVMQYQLADGHTSVKFVRPAHRLLALWGADIVPVSTLGLTASRETSGHRFMGQSTLLITSADTWATQLRNEGMVIPAFSERRVEIARQLAEHSAALDATIGESPEAVALLDEVTALVEYPSVYAGAFDPAFLSVPPECLILTMRLNQKYFPLFDLHVGTAGGQLTHRFLIVSNMHPEDPRHIIEGNERVVRPRLADAQFFFQTDLKTHLADRVEGLAHSVYHNKLGSQLERIGRVRQIATWLAGALGADARAVTNADRAALLAKADLNTSMVGEFPELQGIMGAYYAVADGEAPNVAQALRDQYRVRLDAAITPETLTSAILFMSERAETLIGIWGIGLAPTGERDPYGLRRAALGLISAYEQLTAGGYLSVSVDSPARLSALLAQAASNFTAGVIAPDTVDAVRTFVYERYRNQLNNEQAEHPFGRQSVDAVLALQPPLHQVRARVEACASFATRPEAQNLAAANKRISNLLKKSGGVTDKPSDDSQSEQVVSAAFDPALAVEPAEHVLYDTITRLAPIAQTQAQAGDFSASLSTLAQAREPVDAFFKDVMVMAEDPQLRANRIALLHALHLLMNQVADISKLA